MIFKSIIICVGKIKNEIYYNKKMKGDREHGTGLNFNNLASSIVTAARNKITVMLSINIASIEDIVIAAISLVFVIVYFYFVFGRSMAADASKDIDISAIPAPTTANKPIKNSRVL